MQPTRIVSLLTGLLLLAASLLKWSVLPLFANFLAALDVPLPALFAVLVPLVETIGGLALLTGRAVRPAAALLAVDMIVAIVLVGLPGLGGKAFRVGSHSVGNEPWRLPLEAGLLLALCFLLWPRRTT